MEQKVGKKPIWTKEFRKLNEVTTASETDVAKDISNFFFIYWI